MILQKFFQSNMHWSGQYMMTRVQICVFISKNEVIRYIVRNLLPDLDRNNVIFGSIF